MGPCCDLSSHRMLHMAHHSPKPSGPGPAKLQVVDNPLYSPLSFAMIQSRSPTSKPYNSPVARWTDGMLYRTVTAAAGVGASTSSPWVFAPHGIQFLGKELMVLYQELQFLRQQVPCAMHCQLPAADCNYGMCTCS